MTSSPSRPLNNIIYVHIISVENSSDVVGCFFFFNIEMLVKFTVSQQQKAAVRLALDVSKLVKTVPCPCLSVLD